ncbi:unnamed protein product [Pseudo-nitzschia multistriata]|uniref:Uncharacterized protein n=1 Tax=Pseudo-nitzschia multistriata TaxID=183589 RepID=A0A448Z5Q7_9STRA|nr:unnamed protein product [Pseudo-nitzschia multistriata]
MSVNCPKVSQGEAIRSRLIRSLGIQTSKPAPSISLKHKDIIREQNLVALRHQRPANIDANVLSNAASIRRYLNDSEEHGVRTPLSTGQKRRVRFNNVVTEKQIASHKKYSARIKRTLWSDSEEIQENAFRNQLEFQAEGMNWESVLENDEMYLDTNTGELIHPFWVESKDALRLSRG